MVSDHTDSAELTLWESFVNTFELNQSYIFSQLKVKTYHDKHSLFTPEENATIERIEDLQNVVQQKCSSIKHTKEIEQTKIIAVSNLRTLYRCISCRDGNVLPVGQNEPFGRCTECSTALQLDNSPKQTSPLLTAKTASDAVKLLSLNDQLLLIADIPLEDVTDIALLSAHEFRATYNTITNEIVEVLK